MTDEEFLECVAEVLDGELMPAAARRLRCIIARLESPEDWQADDDDA